MTLKKVTETLVLLPGERTMRGGRDMDGSIWLELDGRRITLRPEQALELAKGIFRNLGIELEWPTQQ